MRLPLVFVLCFAPATVAVAQAQLPQAPGAHVVTISPPGRSASEPTIAVDPDHPGHLVGAFGGPVVAWSTDSGRTFTVADSTKPDGWPGGGDVSLTYDDHGQAFLCYLSFNKLGAASYWAHDAGSSGIFVRRSPDGGKTWDTNPVAVKVTRATNAPATQMEDMPRIWSDVQPKSPYRGNLYVAWIEWQTDKSIMLFSRSTDHGATWSTPIRISTHAGMPRDDNG
ncbi:MAG TPA: sialidase family protein, partial [Gemmatimonadaceae bacterium]